MSIEEQIEKMRRDWDERASTNARYFVYTDEVLSDEEFFQTGEETAREVILNDMANICQGKDPKAMRVLEIGCGIGRVTRVLASLFGEVHAVDVSGEMVRQAQETLSRFSNAFIYQNNGMDLAVIPAEPFDFAFSHLVFQHVPSRDIVESYVREAHRLLRPGALFKFQVQGATEIRPHLKSDDTWVGVAFSQEEVVQMAKRCGFESRYRHGAGTQYFWNWFFKEGGASRPAPRW